MRKFLSKVILLILSLLFLGGQSGGNVRGAEDLRVEDSGPRFAARIMIPANQREGAGVASFNLLMAPGSEQVIEMEIESLSTEPIVVLIDIAAATTDDNGELVFRTREGIARDSSLEYALEDIARVEDTRIPLEPGETKTIPITVAMPSSSFDGIIAGGITLRQDLDMGILLEEATDNRVNVYLLETMVFLQQTEVQVMADIQVPRAMAEERDDENVFAVTLQNTEKTFVNEMSLHARVTKIDSTEVLHEIELTGLQMAPNSNFTFTIPLRGEVVEAGDYALHVKVDSDNGSWDISYYPLTITPQLAERMNEEEEVGEESIQIRERLEEISPEVLIFAGSGLLLLILIVLLIVTLVRRKTRSKQNNQVNELMDEMMKQFRGD